jgi:hypothetical protein
LTIAAADLIDEKLVEEKPSDPAGLGMRSSSVLEINTATFLGIQYQLPRTQGILRGQMKNSVQRCRYESKTTLL